jgi:threonine/homoserine/homoserine lactone efflux protein
MLMGQAIGQLLPFAVGVAVSPMAIVAIVLMLVTPRALQNGVAFAVGWMLGIAVLGVILLALAGPAGASSSSAPPAWVDWLKLVLGVLLLVVCVRELRARPAAAPGGSGPKWMETLNDTTPPRAGGLGVVLGAIQPKNLVLIIGAVAAIAQLNLSTSDMVVAWIVFTLIASIGVLVPLGIYLGLGSRAAATLDGLKAWLIEHNAAVMAVLCLVIGIKLIGDAITGLSV